MNQVCPYCRAEFLSGEEPFFCPSCHTPHHSDCFQENGGCTVFGCSSAPADESKVSISSGELRHVEATPGQSSFVPPPPTANGQQSVPPPPPASSYQAASVPPFAFGTFAGYPVGTHSNPAYTIIPPAYYPRKDRIVFILLAVFLGSVGAHNFYAGYNQKAVIQCCLSVFTCFTVSPIIWVWALVEACIVTQDDDGMAFN